MRPDSWGILIDAFPDLQSEENLACPSADGRFVHVDVNIKGTQVKNAFGVDNKGRSQGCFIVEEGKSSPLG